MPEPWARLEARAVLAEEIPAALAEEIPEVPVEEIPAVLAEEIPEVPVEEVPEVLAEEIPEVLAEDLRASPELRAQWEVQAVLLEHREVRPEEQEALEVAPLARADWAE
jgi:hypothetical protein